MLMMLDVDALYIHFEKKHALWQSWAKYSRYSYSSTILLVLVLVLVLEGSILVLILVLEGSVLVLVLEYLVFEINRFYFK